MTTLSGEIVDKMCELLGRWAVPGKLDRTHRNNVAVFWSKKELGLVKFVFVTKYAMEIAVDFSMKDLAKEGNKYIDTTIESVKLAIDDFAKERAKQLPEIIIPTDNKIAAAVGNAVRTVH